MQHDTEMHIKNETIYHTMQLLPHTFIEKVVDRLSMGTDFVRGLQQLDRSGMYCYWEDQ